MPLGRFPLDRVASLDELAADCSLRWSDIVRIAKFDDRKLAEPYDDYLLSYHSGMLVSDARSEMEARGIVPATLREVLCILRERPELLDSDRTMVVYGSKGRFGVDAGYPYLIMVSTIPYISFLPECASVGISSIIITRAATT